MTAPGNAPWVLTVGASNHNGTSDRGDDSVAVFSSRGPTGVTSDAKPDIVAPGVGIESLSAPDSTLYTTRATHSTVVWGSMVVWGTTVVWGSVCSDPVCDTIWNPDVR